MKFIFVLVLTMFTSNVFANEVFITPGSSVTVPAETTVTCNGDSSSNPRCENVYMSTDKRVQTCSNRVMGSRCAMGDFRGICDLALNLGISGSSTMCACQ